MIALQIPGPSWAHNVSARSKLLVFFALSLFLFQATSAWIFIFSSIVVVVCYGSLGRCGFLQIKVLWALRYFILVMLAVHWYRESVYDGWVAVLRLCTMMLAANFVSATTRMDDMLNAIEPLFRSLAIIGISPKKPAFAITLTFRFIPYLLEVFSLKREAYSARGGKRSSWKLLPPMSIHALKTADNVTEALAARGGVTGLKEEV